MLVSILFSVYTTTAFFTILIFSMSRRCQITGKAPSTGNLRSHSNRATRRRFLPNLIRKRVFDPVLNRMVRKRISVAALRTLSKQSLSLAKKAEELALL
jgi:large subunit ribosomal protein L28